MSTPSTRFPPLTLAGVALLSEWRSLTLAVAMAVAGRLVLHLLSGPVFFAEFARAWEAPWLYATTYDPLYLVPEGALTLLLLWPLIKACDAALPSRQRRVA